jgi:hypothetical protein
MTDDNGEDNNVVRVDFKRAQRTSPSDPTAPQKYAVFGRFIDRGKVMVTLDARRPGVTVPTQYAEESQLNLDFSERFGLADFVYDERGVRASLSFNRQPFFCDVPWSSVYSLFSHAEDGERLTWPRSLPSEILEQLPEASIEHLERVLELQVEKLLRQQREHHERELRADEPRVDEPEPVPEEGGVAGDIDDNEAAPESEAPPGDDKPPRGPGLRLVK